MKSTLARVILKEGRDNSLRRQHPWVYSGAIAQIEGEVTDGDPVHIYSQKSEFLATAHYHQSNISAKVISFRKVVLDYDFWLESLKKAADLRRECGLFDNVSTDAYRLVNAEGDFLPGLVVDIYRNCVVMQCHSTGMYRVRHVLADVIRKILGPRLETLYMKGLTETQPSEFLIGNSGETEIIENSIRYKVSFIDAQKTGFFLDQRENRNLVASMARSKTVLNAFCYTGGFSLACLQAGATEVHSVDRSCDALEQLDLNLELNSIKSPHHSHHADCFEYLGQCTLQFDFVILDPPPFAKSRDARDGALKGYRAINHHGIRLLRSNGLLATFSCSQVVSREDLLTAIQKSAEQLGRQVQVLHQLGHPICHPINLHHPEGDYLKGFILRVL